MLGERMSGGGEPGFLLGLERGKQVQEETDTHRAERRFHGDGPVHSDRSGIGMNPMRQKIFCGAAIGVIATEYVRFAKHRKKLQARNLKWRLDIGAVVANAIAKVAGNIRPRFAGNEITVPLWTGA